MKTREIKILGNIAYVPLSQGYVAIIDAADAEFVGQWSWFAHAPYKGLVYANRNQKIEGGRLTIRLHRVLLRPDADMHVDHINGVGLDNRRSNLRVTTASENQWNCGVRSDNTSGFKGVSFIRGQWQARIQKNGKRIVIGCYASPKLAFEAYCKAAKTMHGEFANCGVDSPQTALRHLRVLAA